MLIDGKQIAQNIDISLKKSISLLPYTPRVSVVYVGKNPIIETYISIKQKVAEKIGITIQINSFSEDISTSSLVDKIRNIQSEVDGIIVQLPLPDHIDRERILSSIQPQKDIDVLSIEAYNSFIKGESEIYPPVVGAIDKIFKNHDVKLRDKKIVIVGKGMLVGKPVFEWLTKREKLENVAMLDRGDDVDSFLKTADVIISGTGCGWCITPDKIKEGVILIDAGTSIEEGVSRGDINPTCVKKASYMSPVPGGIGPITVRILFQNLLHLIKNRDIAK